MVKNSSIPFAVSLRFFRVLSVLRSLQSTKVSECIHSISTSSVQAVTCQDTHLHVWPRAPELRESLHYLSYHTKGLRTTVLPSCSSIAWETVRGDLITLPRPTPSPMPRCILGIQSLLLPSSPKLSRFSPDPKTLRPNSIYPSSLSIAFRMEQKNEKEEPSFFPHALCISVACGEPNKGQDSQKP